MIFAFSSSLNRSSSDPTEFNRSTWIVCPSGSLKHIDDVFILSLSVQGDTIPSPALISVRSIDTPLSLSLPVLCYTSIGRRERHTHTENVQLMARLGGETTDMSLCIVQRGRKTNQQGTEIEKEREICRVQSARDNLLACSLSC